jgi:hypothetical protein
MIPVVFIKDEMLKWKAKIRREIRNIDKNILKITFLNFSKRCDLIIKVIK